MRVLLIFVVLLVCVPSAIAATTGKDKENGTIATVNGKKVTFTLPHAGSIRGIRGHRVFVFCGRQAIGAKLQQKNAKWPSNRNKLTVTFKKSIAIGICGVDQADGKMNRNIAVVFGI